MNSKKRIICAFVLCAILLTTLVVLDKMQSSGEDASSDVAMPYVNSIFDDSYVHTVNIVSNKWDSLTQDPYSREFVKASVEIDGDTLDNVGMRIKGVSSIYDAVDTHTTRFSLKLSFGKYNKGATFDGLDKLNLNNLAYDPTMMKDYLCSKLFNNFGVDAPLASFSYVTMNGYPLGLYINMEQVEDSFLARTKNGTGNLYKPFSTAESDETGEAIKNPDGTYKVRGGAVSRLQYVDGDIATYHDIFDNAKTKPSELDQRHLIESLRNLSQQTSLDSAIDEDQVMRYCVVYNFIVDNDSYLGHLMHNYYLYEDQGKLAMVPWDFNMAFGAFESASASEPINKPINEVYADRPMQSWIFSDEAHVDTYHKLYRDFLTTCNVQGMITKTQDLIAPYVQAPGEYFFSYDDFNNGVLALMQFVTLREESVQGQLEGWIPSTLAGQKSNPKKLISAGDLTTESTGSWLGTIGNEDEDD